MKPRIDMQNKLKLSSILEHFSMSSILDELENYACNMADMLENEPEWVTDFQEYDELAEKLSAIKCEV